MVSRRIVGHHGFRRVELDQIAVGTRLWPGPASPAGWCWGQDSNLRRGYPTGLQIRCIQPLCHPSICASIACGPARSHASIRCPGPPPIARAPPRRASENRFAARRTGSPWVAGSSLPGVPQARTRRAGVARRHVFVGCLQLLQHALDHFVDSGPGALYGRIAVIAQLVADEGAGCDGPAQVVTQARYQRFELFNAGSVRRGLLFAQVTPFVPNDLPDRPRPMQEQASNRNLWRGIAPNRDATIRTAITAVHCDETQYNATHSARKCAVPQPARVSRSSPVTVGRPYWPAAPGGLLPHASRSGPCRRPTACRNRGRVRRCDAGTAPRRMV